MNWRSPKLLNKLNKLSLAGLLPCYWPIHHLCRGAVEAAHSNQQCDGKGMGIKAHDYRIALLCHNAHAELDQGRQYTKDEKRIAWEAAHRRTIGLLFTDEIVKVA